METRRRHAVKGFVDKCVIYYTTTDKCWVAHSLHTDQIGVGDCVVEALSELLKAVDFVLEDAAKDPTLAVFRDAPDSVQNMAKHAKPLPHEVFDIAHKLVRGTWPTEIEPKFNLPRRQPYVAALKEEKSVGV